MKFLHVSDPVIIIKVDLHKIHLYVHELHRKKALPLYAPEKIQLQLVKR